MPEPLAPSLQRLHAAIDAQRDNFTPTGRRIAAYLLEHPEDVALFSVQELATELRTGPASIIRTVQKLGYSGLSELKKTLRSTLQRERSPLEQFGMSLDDAGGEVPPAVAAIAKREARNIADTMRAFDERAFRGAVEALERAHTVYVLGVGVSAHLAGLAAFVLQHVGLRSFALQHTGLKLSEQLIRAGKRDALLAFSFPPYSAQTIEACRLAREQGVRVVAITNSAVAPIAACCGVVLVAKTDSLTPSNSVSAPLVLVHGLAAAIAQRARPRSLKAIKTTLSIRVDD
jgi:DNA-binding MurR/RpiR family transcriptional regulator